MPLAKTRFMTGPSRDHYGGHAADYRRFRPTYPESLFTQLLQLAPLKNLAWDCGTGSGQVATRLARDFDRVWATDLSEKQLEQAEPHERVSYHAAEAHQSGLKDNSVSLLTVATAVHWFDHTSFYEEARRVLMPGGVLAVWTYGPDLEAPDALGKVVRNLSTELNSDWPTGIEWVQGRYRELPFPFPLIELKPVRFSLTWSLEELFGWVSTWSAVHRRRQRTGKEPLEGVWESLEQAWPTTLNEPATLVMPLYYKVGRKA